MAAKRFNESWFNFPVDGIFRLNAFPDQVLFCYGGAETRDWFLCTSVYDSIVFDNTGENIIQHNLKNFLSDSLLTCLNYQQSIDSRINPFQSREQRLLFLSLYL